MESYQYPHPVTKEIFTFSFTTHGVIYLHNYDNSIRLVSIDKIFKDILECMCTEEYFIVHVNFNDECIQANYILYNKNEFIMAETGTYQPVYLEIGHEFEGNPEFDKNTMGILFENKNNRTVQRYSLNEIYYNKTEIYHKHFMERIYYDFNQNSYLKNKITQYCNNTSNIDKCDILIDFLSLDTFFSYEVFLGDLGNDLAYDEIGNKLLQIKGIHKTKDIYEKLEIHDNIEEIEINVVFNELVQFTLRADEKKNKYKTELRVLK